ncbi:MAG: hypothetical protein M3020_03810 [Myxococcota bacterium]|nr:hypothetical protein [Myxococcota bacterium]
MLRFRRWELWVAPLLLVANARPASAQVMQPTGEVMPTPVGAAELDVVTSRGFGEDAITLEGLFLNRGETLDPVADAKIAPGAFSPLCGFSGELLLRGGGCKVALGWYNVDPAGKPPAMGEIYTLVPADPTDPVMGLGCEDNDFCPLATMNTTQTGQHQWTPRTYSAMNIRSDPRFKGGQVGFALIGNPSIECKQTKYSEASLNDKSPSGAPWVTTLIYQSTATPDAYYIAFEDLPTSPMTWKGQGGQFVNDGDFNDFVFFVTGLTCKGAGQPCETGLVGACGNGLTDCTEDGSVGQCRPVINPSPERCDNVDNDCDGTVDEEAPCPDNKQCFQGKCVASCSTGEFVCPRTFSCNDAGVCIDLACQTVQCGEGEVCVGGTCRGACDGVVCPLQQVCQLGRCIDLCAGVTCEGEKVCEKGICVQNCGCRTCADGQVCAPDGRCLDAGCESLACAAGEVCQGGACLDACAGAICPGNAPCIQGVCGEPLVGSAPGAGAGAEGGMGGMVSVVINPTGMGGAGSVPVPGSTSTPSPSGPGVTGRRGHTSQESGCMFGGALGGSGAPALFAGLGLVGFALRRWRTRRARSRSATG